MKARTTKTEKSREIINWAIGIKVSELNGKKWDKELEKFEGEYSEFRSSFRRIDIDEKLALRRILKRININKVSKGLQEQNIARVLLDSKNIEIIHDVVTDLFEEK